MFSKVIVSFACRTFTTTNHFRRSSTGASQEHFALFDKPPYTQPSKNVTGKMMGELMGTHVDCKTQRSWNTRVKVYGVGVSAKGTYVETEWKSCKGDRPNVNEMLMNLI